MIVERFVLTIALAAGANSPIAPKTIESVAGHRRIEQQTTINIPQRVSEFKERIENPNRRLGIIGVIAFDHDSEIFALPVEGQYGNPALVWENTITQFYQPLLDQKSANYVLLSELYGSTGPEFKKLVYGDVIAIVLGNGEVKYYEISDAIIGSSKYASSMYSNIVINGQEMTVEEASHILYEDNTEPVKSGEIITLQTCIDDIRKLFLFGKKIDNKVLYNKIVAR